MTPFGAQVWREMAHAGGEAGPLVVAVSGGMDSVVLLRSLVEAGAEVVVAHVDHGLQPGSAEAAAWVAALADDLGVPSETWRVEVKEGNVQAQAREARYDALGALAERVGSRFVVVAHTATDQAETLLLHLTRGAGLRGLSGMPLIRSLADGPVSLVRPMLWASRQEVENEARRNGWAWREDPSNGTDRYRRNRIRHRVIPALEAEGGPQTVERIARTAGLVRQSLAAFEHVFQTHAVADARGGRVPLRPQAEMPEALRRALWTTALHTWAPGAPVRYEIVEAIDALVERPVGARVLLPGLTVWREREALRFETTQTRTADVAEIRAPLAEDGAVIGTDEGTLEIRPGDGTPSDDPCCECVDARSLGEAAVLRPWRDGDRFRPLGLGGSKLVSDLLTERRVPPSERARQRVLCGDDGRIVWVVGHRLSEHAAVGDETAYPLTLRWTPASIAGSEGAG